MAYGLRVRGLGVLVFFLMGSFLKGSVLRCPIGSVAFGLYRGSGFKGFYKVPFHFFDDCINLEKYPLNKEYTLNHHIKAPGIFPN